MQGQERDWARGNEAADWLAKFALSLHPRWSRYERDEADRSWERAVAIATLSAKAIARWPKATRAPRKPRSTDKRQQEEQRRQRLEAQQREAQAAFATHAWRRWHGVGAQERCARCAALSGQPAALRPCTTGLTRVEEAAERGRAQGHTVWIATVQGPGSALASLMAVCNVCGAYSQGCPAASRLSGICRPTGRSLATLGRIRRGLHPRFGSAHIISSYEPIVWGEAEAVDEHGSS